MDCILEDSTSTLVVSGEVVFYNRCFVRSFAYVQPASRKVPVVASAMVRKKGLFAMFFKLVQSAALRNLFCPYHTRVSQLGGYPSSWWDAMTSISPSLWWRSSQKQVRKVVLPGMVLAAGVGYQKYVPDHLSLLCTWYTRADVFTKETLNQRSTFFYWFSWRFKLEIAAAAAIVILCHVIKASFDLAEKLAKLIVTKVKYSSAFLSLLKQGILISC